MGSSDFVQEETKQLVAQLSGYLSQKVTHEEIQSYVESVVERWEKLNQEPNGPYSEGEKELWCALWSIQHLASEDHWSEGVTQKDLGFLLNVLRGESVLPPEYVGKRP